MFHRESLHDKHVISGGRRSLRHVLFQAGLAAACHNPVLKVVARRTKEWGKPHKLVIVAITRRLITIANAVSKQACHGALAPSVKHSC